MKKSIKGEMMKKKIASLNWKEVDKVCFSRRKKYGEDKKGCCNECPLRYQNTCLACQGFESMKKLLNNIGDNLVEVNDDE